MMKKLSILLIPLLIISTFIQLSSVAQETNNTLRKDLEVSFSKNPSQIEIGGPFAGIEMHNSSPLLKRISFFYPVANSIDFSTDYWERDKARTMLLGLKVGNKNKEWIGLSPFDYRLTPYSVVFNKQDKEKTLNISYDFCKNKPAMVFKTEITNNSTESENFEFYTHLETSIKTSHTYTLNNKAWTDFDKTGNTIYTNFDSVETGNTQIFVANAGETPAGFTTWLPEKEKNQWIENNSDLSRKIIDKTNPDQPVSVFVYKKNLLPKQKMTVIQIIGSCKQDEGKEIVKYLLNNYDKETKLYEQSVLNKVYKNGVLETGDKGIDHSTRWAKAIMEANYHYLDNDMVPMPCPAEYNFFFTHDVMLTDLAAVNFDITRVKKDLEYVVKHTNEKGIIPHAYYWKDDRYVTEFATPENWNHFWFVMVSARYLRHSDDIKTIETIYPILNNSVNQMLINKKDDLIWAYRPDWWDIGSSFGPRAYMTILAIRTLREFIYISTVLGKNSGEMLQYEEIANKMQYQLNEKLWDKKLNYLINFYKDGKVDPHLYIGSLPGVHFNLLDDNKNKALVQTAKKYLLDEKLGIYNAFPMDYHLLGDYLKFSGNEAGAPFLYMNGGIWPHGNAWYSLALISIGEKEQAFRFIKNTMTLEGIMNSPNGQPAMYECRNGNKKDTSVYGKVDKPQFLWAGAWYIYSLYNLLGLRENECNISFDPYLFQSQKISRYTLFVKGKPITVSVKGFGDYIKNIKYDDLSIPSAVIPLDVPINEKIEILLGKPEIPYIYHSDSILNSCLFDEKTKKLTLTFKAFQGHKDQIKLISPWRPESVFINELEFKGAVIKQEKNIYKINIDFFHQSVKDKIVVRF